MSQRDSTFGVSLTARVMIKDHKSSAWPITPIDCFVYLRVIDYTNIGLSSTVHKRSGYDNLMYSVVYLVEKDDIVCHTFSRTPSWGEIIFVCV